MSFKINKIPANSLKDFEFDIKNHSEKNKKKVISCDRDNNLCVISYTIPKWALKFMVRHKFVDKFLPKSTAGYIKLIRDNKANTILKLQHRKIKIVNPENKLTPENDKTKLLLPDIISFEVLEVINSSSVTDQNNTIADITNNNQQVDKNDIVIDNEDKDNDIDITIKPLNIPKVLI